MTMSHILAMKDYYAQSVYGVRCLSIYLQYTVKRSARTANWRDRAKLVILKERRYNAVEWTLKRCLFQRCVPARLGIQNTHPSGHMAFKQRRLNVDASTLNWLCWGLTTRQPLRVILCRLPEKGRKEIEERVEEMKERDREERGTGMKVKKQKK